MQEGGVLFDLGDQLDPLRDQRPELGQVLGAPHEGHADVVHPQRHRVLHFLPVLLGHRRGAHVHAGQVHALVRAEEAAVPHHPVHPVPADTGHLDRQEAVVEQDLGARFHVLGQRSVGRGQLPRASPLLGSEGDLLARRELPGLRQVADPDPGAVQVHQDRHRVCSPLPDLLEVPDPLGPKLGCPVRGVHPDDIDPGVQQLGHAGGMGPRRPQGGHDLGAANGRTRQARLGEGSEGIRNVGGGSGAAGPQGRRAAGHQGPPPTEVGSGWSSGRNRSRPLRAAVSPGTRPDRPTDHSLRRPRPRCRGANQSRPARPSRVIHTRDGSSGPGASRPARGSRPIPKMGTAWIHHFHFPTPIRAGREVAGRWLSTLMLKGQKMPTS